MTVDRESAAALKYSSLDSLPEILARGEGLTAQKILELAEEHGIPVEENSSLMALLDQAPQVGAIPEVAFGLVAEVLCFLYEIDAKFRDEHQFMEKI